MILLPWLMALYLTAAWDDTFRTLLAIGGVGPEPLVMLGLLWSLTARGWSAIAGAALVGVVADLAGTGRLGPCLFALGLAALAIERSRGLGLAGRPAGQAALLGAFLAVIVCSLSLPVALHVAEACDWGGFAQWALAKGFYATALGWPLLAAIARAHAWFGGHTSTFSHGYLDLARR